MKTIRSHKEIMADIEKNTKKRQELDAEKDELIKIYQARLDGLKSYITKEDKLSW